MVSFHSWALAPAHNLFGVVDEHMSDGRELKHNHDEAERHPTSGWSREPSGRRHNYGREIAEKQRFGAESVEIRLTWPSAGRWATERR